MFKNWLCTTMIYDVEELATTPRLYRMHRSNRVSMSPDRMPKQMIEQAPYGKWNVGGPRVLW